MRDKPLGRVKDILFKIGNTSMSCPPRSSITNPTATVKVPNTEVESWNSDPANPITPPKTKKEIIRPRLKYKCGVNFSIPLASGFLAEKRAEAPSTRPPTSAIHVEIPAVRPTRKTMGKLE